ncbi:SpoIIE family protein phosphatase [Candidatus Ozemobacteraceae bacterium]|nr:SpoIIE family protein phosphatase [Candidatus Ozemobacteraceae bacterium]
MTDKPASEAPFHPALGRSLFHSLGDGIVIADRDGNVVFLNRQAEEILSVALDDIRGKPMDACHRCPWKIRKIVGESGAEKPYRAEVPVGDRWLSVTATSLRGENGDCVGYVMTARDTTDRHMLETALKKSVFELRERQEKIDLQIELARTIQKALMPPDVSTFPGARVRLWNAQSQIVGGDVMFVREEADGGWLMLGDIMGKGLFASQFVPLLHGFVRDELPSASTPAGLLQKLNDRLVGFIADRFPLFVTMVCLRWTRDTRSVQIACAGNENPYLVGADGAVSKIELQNPPLGLCGSDGYQARELSLPPGCRILCWSDGVTEVHKNDPSLDRDWLERKIGEWISAGRDPFGELVGHLKQAAESNVPHDDQSLMILEV